jgi:tripartite ATP-independent transporter DctM subunit
MRGGLGQVNIAASTLFGGISGSAVAEAAAVGGIMIPQMKQRGYGADYAVNVTSMAALIALLLPPSHNMIIYSLSGGGNISIADLFTAGIIPGLLLAAALSVTAWLVAIRRGYPTEPFPGFRKAGYYFLVSIPGLMLIVIIFGGVRSGVFTATESSCIAVIYALLVTLLIYRSLNWGEFVHAVLGAVRTTAMVLFIIGAAASFAWLMAYLKVATILTAGMASISSDPLLVLLMINVVLLLLGTFMDMGPLIIITTPIFLPMVKAFGVDPVHFGVIMILNLGIGLNTPPLGPVQFVAAAVGKITVMEAMKSIWPFYGAGLVVLGLVTYIPALSLWLPALFRG